MTGAREENSRHPPQQVNPQVEDFRPAEGAPFRGELEKLLGHPDQQNGGQKDHEGPQVDGQIKSPQNEEDQKAEQGQVGDNMHPFGSKDVIEMGAEKGGFFTRPIQGENHAQNEQEQQGSSTVHRLDYKMKAGKHNHLGAPDQALKCNRSGRIDEGAVCVKAPFSYLLRNSRNAIILYQAWKQCVSIVAHRIKSTGFT
jgi:hypothetical protein